MKKPLLINLYFSLIVLISAASTAGSAAVPSDRGIGNSLLAPAPSQAETDISRREASDLAREKFEGRVLSIRLSEKRWRVRMDDEGRVFNVFVDSKDGTVSSSSE